MHIDRTKRSKLGLMLAAVVLLAALGAAVLGGRHPSGDAVRLSELELQIGSGANTQTIRLWRQGQGEDGQPDGTLGDGYFFLPAYADPDNLRLLYDPSACTVALNGQTIPSGVRLGGVENGSAFSLTFTDSAGAAETIALHFVQSANLPALFISTASGSMADIRADKVYREAGTLQLVQTGGRVEYNGPLEYLTGRGNQTWTLDKRGYGFKLGEAADLLGMGEAKKWVLLANAFDDSMLRNTIAYTMARRLGLESSPDSEFCDLYLNGTYAGTYQLCEKAEIHENRVDITDLEQANVLANPAGLTVEKVLDEETNTAWTTLPQDPKDITGGYLLERDYGDKYQEENCWFTTEANETFVLRSPANASHSEVDYIEQTMQRLENAILSPDGIDAESGLSYTELLDLDSWVRTFLVDEFTKNEGGGASSAWYYKDSDSADSAIYSGPVWDYDKSLGRYMRWASPEGLMLMEYHDVPTPYFSALYQKEDYRAAVIQVYAEQLRPYVQELLDGLLQQWADRLCPSWEMDRLRWGSFYGWLSFYNDTSSLQSCVDYLTDWMESRMEFLDSVWLDGQEYYTVKLDSEMRGTPYYYLYAKAGQPLDFLPEGRGGEGEFLGWVLEGTDTIVDTSTPITGDCRLQSMWSGAEPSGE